MSGPWAWHPHLLSWGALALVGVATVLGHRRLARRVDAPLPWPRARAWRFAGGLVLIGICMGWPLGDLAAHWSLSALVLQRCILVLAVAPLLLSGLSDDLVRWLTRPAPVDALLVRVVRPPVAVIAVTVLLVSSMAPGLVAAQSSSGTGKWMSTSSGVSPSTSTCHPVSRRSQAGSTSAVRYQLALNVTSGRPFRMPLTCIRCAAMVPAGTRPAAISTSWRAVAT